MLPPNRSNSSQRGADVVMLLCAGLLLAALWSWALPSDPAADESFAYPSHEYFPLMVEGWLQGRLDLPMPGLDALLALPDPHDPVANESLRYGGAHGVHDLSLYDGRLYMYWGPAPALLAFLPWRLLTGDGLDTSWAIWVFLLAGWAFAALLLRQVVSQFFPHTSLTVQFFVFAMLGVANAAVFVVHRPSVFELSISAAYMCTSLAWWQLARALWCPPRQRLLPLAVASLAMGLAVATRVSWVVVSPVLLVALWDVRSQWRSPLVRRLVVCAAGPLAVCGIGLLVLNMLRFDSPFEFGLSYQLSGVRPSEESFGLHHVPFGSYMYLLAPPATSDYFPFLLPSAAADVPAGSKGSENVFGLLPLLPVLAAACLAPLTARVMRLHRVVVILGVMFVAILGVLTILPGVVLRYELDLAPLLVLLAAIGVLAGEDRWRASSARRRSFRALWSVALALTLVQSIAAAYALSPERTHAAPMRLKSWAHAIALTTGWSADAVIARLELKLMLPVGIPRTKEEVLVATGRVPRTNIVYLRRPSATELIVGFERGDGLRVESEPHAVDAGTPQNLWVELGAFYPPQSHPFWTHVDSARTRHLRERIRVGMDDEVLLNGYAPQWDTANADPLVGAGGADDSRRFSGTILEVNRILQPLK